LQRLAVFRQPRKDGVEVVVEVLVVDVLRLAGLQVQPLLARRRWMKRLEQTRVVLNKVGHFDFVHLKKSLLLNVFVIMILCHRVMAKCQSLRYVQRNVMPKQ
jgi:hypothetical protein